MVLYENICLEVMSGLGREKFRDFETETFKNDPDDFNEFRFNIKDGYIY